MNVTFDLEGNLRMLLLCSLGKRWPASYQECGQRAGSWKQSKLTHVGGGCGNLWLRSLVDI